MPGEENGGYSYPLTNMNFLVTFGENLTAAFTEVSGVEATVEEIEFRQGNSTSLAPVKIPGLIKHGSVTMKMGYTTDNQLINWIYNCIKEQRTGFARKDVTIELIDIRTESPAQPVQTDAARPAWKLKNAWVTKYSAPDLNASGKEVAIESIELAYEELVTPGRAAAGGGGGESGAE